MKEKERYVQMSKNTVSSEAQLKETDFVKFDNPQGKGIRVMFVGNSITLHGILPEIGWYNECGMAASSAENDYVHILETGIRKTDPEAAFCICQVASWEGNYKDGSEMLSLYDEARRFCADIIILRFIENIKAREYDTDIFLSQLDALVAHLDGTRKARLVITTGFWRHPGDKDIIAYAKEKDIPFVELGDLGEDDRMKAIGLFEHGGVANHPGDEGMRAIAERITEVMIRNNYITVLSKR